MSGSATPANSNVQHNSLLRTRKSDRDLETVDRSEIIEMGEEEWMPNLKENKRRWTPYSVMIKKKGFFLIAITYIINSKSTIFYLLLSCFYCYAINLLQRKQCL